MRVAGAIFQLPKWMAVLGILTAVSLGTQIPAGRRRTNRVGSDRVLDDVARALAPPLAVDQSLLVIGVPGAGGWVDGPRIKGKLVGPAGDWLRVTPSGNPSPRCARNDPD